MFYNTAIAMFPNDRITNWRGTPSIKKQVVSPSQRNDLHMCQIYCIYCLEHSARLSCVEQECVDRTDQANQNYTGNTDYQACTLAPM